MVLTVENVSALATAAKYVHTARERESESTERERERETEREWFLFIAAYRADG